MAADPPDDPADSSDPASPPSGGPTPGPARVPRHRRRWPWVVAAIVLSPVVLFALWTVIALNFSYSSGNRAGYVQKFSKKGWLCKTWEGELAMVNVPGALQERWDFTVRDDSIAQLILNDMGDRVSLTYDQHQGIPSSCFGETQYFVTGVRKVAP
ncbi:MAG TPA: hypothetical protein VJU87_00915 [Gemmatimonadaceae bacterium]|nr:hypothetical protein [Gemmatimonadaceae bacterium]